jgi:hypothetical protein
VMPRLAVPNSLASRPLQCLYGKGGVTCLDFLQASDVRLGLGKPFEEPRETALDAVHVERRDLHTGLVEVMLMPHRATGPQMLRHSPPPIFSEGAPTAEDVARARELFLRALFQVAALVRALVEGLLPISSCRSASGKSSERSDRPSRAACTPS